MSKLITSSVIRISRGDFNPERFQEVEAMAQRTGTYLVPAISKLEGQIGYFCGLSPAGAMVHVRFWDSDKHAQQMSTLREMIVDARSEGERAGLAFTPIMNYPVVWKI